MKILYINADQLPNKMHELIIHIVLPKNRVTITTKAPIEITGFELFINIEDQNIGDLHCISVTI